MRKLTKLEIIDRSNEVHKYKYIYDKMDYVNAKTKVCIICPEHGEFWQTINKHLQGQGCPKCAGNQALTTETFIEKARQVHGNEYIYDKTVYKNNKSKVIVTCKIHGDFKVNAGNHLKGCKCPKCVGGIQYTKEEFIERANKVHNNKYIYDNVVYINSQTPIDIICPIHGVFKQTPAHHLYGVGCPICGGSQKLDTETFIEKAKQVHGDEYVYNRKKINYINNGTKVCITCRKHGDFWQTPRSHLKGSGCPICYGFRPYSNDEYIKKAEKIHKGKYIYDDIRYVNASGLIDIICPIHGKFQQRASDHLQSKGCPICGHHMSLAENELYDSITKIIGDKNIIKNDRKVLEGKEIDLLVPSIKLGIEYNGLKWHSEEFNKDKNYHLHKTELAESKGYHLIHIFEDEWLEHKELVLNKIKHFLGCDSDKSVIGARKSSVKMISKTLSEEFLNTYHLQGFVASTAYYGAFYGDILVGVMSFKQEKQGMWNLTRFATNTDYRLPGLANKIFKQFIKDNNPIEVKTFLDRRWSHCSENLYDKMGFKLEETLLPDYRYVIKNQRLHKFGFRKQILHKKYGLPLTMTEREMTEQLGFYRIWDCGLYKYVWKRND